MPSSKPLPTISQFLQAAQNAAKGQIDRNADTRTGAIYDHIAGPTALLFAREADQDQANFRAIYFDDATGDELTNRVQGLWQIDRMLDTFGPGTCTFKRSSSAAGGDTFWTGTRIQIPGNPPSVYEVAVDTPVPSTATSVDIPIQATTPGTGVACNVNAGLVLLDPVYDPLWLPTSIVCSDGTAFEAATPYVARARQQRAAARTGYFPSLRDACVAAGASYVVGFTSTYGLAEDDFDSDCGLNAIYVADKSFQSPDSLVAACYVALESVRMLGADLWVGGISQLALSVAAVVHLVDDPGKLPVVAIRQAATKALLAYFRPTSAGYTYDLDKMGGAMVEAHGAIQQVSFTSPGAAPPLPDLSGPVVQGWPAVLTRYTLAPSAIQLTFAGPV